ncbi:polyprenyl synthetase family protein [Streptomyces sp. NPDC001635]|nr:polyprenyl synthetase family protein [Streptomyces sp. T1317-0309]
MTPRPVTRPVDLEAIRDRIDAVLTEFLESKAGEAAGRRLPAEVTEVLRDFLLRGGKRLRPLLCALGWQAAGGHGTPAPVVRVAASLEMFHAFCLIHDDVMDRSTTRRGGPTVQCSLTIRHDGHPAAAHLGTSAAILVGDLALVWSDELLHSAGLTRTQLSTVRPLIYAMRTEVMYGQYLDLLSTGHLVDQTDTAFEAIRYKTAKYTCERPLHIGASLAGAPLALLDVLTAYSLPLGEAFQLRDDLLGVFGDPQTTGKPALDDLREGKRTVLTALAFQRSAPAQRDLLRALIGRPGLNESHAERIRTVLETTGARNAVEDMIRARREQALNALDRASLPGPTTDALRHIAHTATTRAA